MVTLQIVVTEKCNLNCSYCYMDNVNTFLTRETFMEFYESLLSNEEYAIDFFGGEPLLNFDMVKFIIETVSDDPRFISFYMPSNGLLLTQVIVDFLKENNVNFSWSCDGINDEGVDAYINKVDLIGQLCNTVSVVVSKHHMSMLENHKFFRQYFGMTPNFHVVREDWPETSMKVFKIMYGRYIDWLITEFKENRIDIPVNIINDIKSLYSATKYNDERLKCIESDRICLMPDGRTGFCARMCTEGDLTNPDGTGLYDKCEDCEIKLVCEQGCYHMVKQHGIDHNLCEIYKTMFNEAIGLNHRLKSDGYWVNKYIKGMFDNG